MIVYIGNVCVKLYQKLLQSPLLICLFEYFDLLIGIDLV